MKTYFWKKFSKYLLIGLSVMVLFSLLQKVTINEVLQRGPNVVLADEDNCAINPGALGCPNPGEVIGEEPLPPEPAPAAPAQPACTERSYNECVACNTSRPVKEKNCGGALTWDVGGNQSDSACSSWCQSAPAAPAPAGAPVGAPAPAAPAAPAAPPAAPPVAPPPAGPSTVSACGKTGVLAPGYTLYTPATCSASQYLYVNVDSGGYLTNACVAVPAGKVKTADGCSAQDAVVTPPAGPSTVSACGKTGVLAPGYTLYTPASCSSSQYLYVNVEGGYLTNACLSVPSGNAKTADGCSYAPISAPPACISNRSCNASVPACGTTTTGVDNCGNSCSRQGVACTIPQGAPVITNTFNPTNTNTNSNTNTITNNVTREVVREVAVAPATFGNVGVGTTAPVVQYTTLPKTGLPELAWSALAFIPAGFSLRRFSKMKKALENHPSFIWEDRQFKSDSLVG